MNFELSLIIDEKVLVNIDTVLVKTLLNISAEINIISQHFMTEYQFSHMKDELSQSQFLNRQKSYCYKTY